MSIRVGRCRLRCLLLPSLLVWSLGAGAAQGPEVLGCPIGPDVNALISCVRDASGDAVAEATAALNQTVSGLRAQVETLQSSPFLALPAEQVQAFSQCLSAAGLDTGTVMAASAANPVAFGQARMAELSDAALALREPLLGATMDALATGRLPADTPQALDAYAGQAYAGLVRLAEEDPVARCALPLVTPLQAQIRQASVAAYQAALDTAQQLAEQTVRPALEQALAASLGVMLEQMRGTAAAGKPSTGQRQPGSGRRPPPSLRTTGKAPAAAASTDSRQASAQKRAAGKEALPRTRSIREAAQSAAAGAVPGDVQRIALAVFTERMLDPARVAALTQQVNGLAAALADGSGAAFDLTDLDKLIGELATPSDQIATEMGLEVASYYGHWIIDEVGGPLVDLGIGSVSAANAFAEEVSTVICAIGVVFSESGCAMVRGIASMLYLQIGVPMIRHGLLAGGHVQYQMALDCAAQAIRAGQAPARMPAANCTALGGIARQFPSGEQLAAFVLPQVEAPRMALLGYQQAVRNLATVSRNVSGRR